MRRLLRDREREMAEEMRAHLEHRVAQKMAAGMPEAEARAAAAREFGNIEVWKLSAREQRRTWRLATIARDIRFGLRVLRRSPAFALTAILTLTLGVGANVAVFSVVRGVLLESPPFPDAERVVSVMRNVERSRGHQLSPTDLEVIRTRSTAVAYVAGSLLEQVAARGDADPERVVAERVEPQFFDVYQVRPARGRALGHSDADPSARVVVISDALWGRQFGRREDVVGQTLYLGRDAFSVVGVMPPEFFTNPNATIDTDVWRLMTAGPSERVATLSTVARLRPETSIDDARAQLTALLPPVNVELFDGQVLKHLGVIVSPVGSSEAVALRPGLLLLQGVAAFLLLIMCANLANVFLAHASDRRREFGVRTALGAGRARLVCQLLTETAVIAVFGGAAACLVAYLTAPLVYALAQDLLPRTATIAVRFPELAAAFGLAFATALLFAGIPAWVVSRSDPLRADRGAGTSTASRGARAYRATLVSAQVLLALVVLVGSGLLLRSFGRLLSQPLGFDPEGLVTAHVQVPTATTKPREEAAVFARRLNDELQSRLPPGSYIVGGDAPFSPQGTTNWQLVPPEGGAPLRHEMAGARSIAPGALQFLGIRLLQGRYLTDADGSGSMPVAVVSESFARRFGRGRDVMGSTVVAGTRPPATIVGVVADVRATSLGSTAAEAVYQPYAQWSSSSMVVATRGISEYAAARAIADAVRTIDSTVPVTDVGEVDKKILKRERRRGFYLVMLSVFAALALLLTGVGIYGVVAHVTRGRTREMGIRLALGARPHGLVRMVVQHSLIPVGLGLGAGLVAAWWTTRLLQTNPVVKAQLFQTSPHDPLTFATGSAVLLAVAAIACWLPARSAAAARVTDVLRTE